MDNILHNNFLNKKIFQNTKEFNNKPFNFNKNYFIKNSEFFIDQVDLVNNLYKYHAYKTLFNYNIVNRYNLPEIVDQIKNYNNFNQNIKNFNILQYIQNFNNIEKFSINFLRNSINSAYQSIDLLEIKHM
jgi:hypothetical protein